MADYISNRISVTDIANGQKGILAKEDIKRGTLLVAAKAVSTVFKNTSNSHLTRVDINKNSYDLNDGSQNFVNIVTSLNHKFKFKFFKNHNDFRNKILIW